MQDRVILVRVTARAGQGEAEPHRARRLHAVKGVLGLILLHDGPALAGTKIATHVAGTNLLIHRRLGQQVARNLFGGELVERLVGVKGVDDPLAVFPQAALGIDVVAVRIRVARRVEPVPRRVLAITRRGEQTVHDFFVSSGRLVSEEGIHFVRRRRQSREVLRHAADEGGLVRFRRGPELFLVQLREDERVNLVLRPLLVLNHGQRRTFRSFVSPVRLPGRAFGDPALEKIDLCGRKLFARLRRRHDFLGIARRDARHHLALLQVAGNNRVVAGLRGLERLVLHVQPQLALALVFVRPVAGEAVVREQRADVAVELDGLRRWLGCRRRDAALRPRQQRQRDQTRDSFRHHGVVFGNCGKLRATRAEIRRTFARPH